MEALKPADAFTYLGRTITYNNRYWVAVYHNLRKDWRIWGMIQKLQTNIGAMVRARSMLYKAVAQTVLLYGSESWVMTGAMMKLLESYHGRTAQRIAGMMDRRMEDGDWYYPPVAYTL